MTRRGRLGTRAARLALAALLAFAGDASVARALTRPGDDAIRLPTVMAEGVPRGLVTITVPIPAELANETDVSFEVRLSGEVEVLGRLRGPARVAGGTSRPLVLTLRVPAVADAGTVDAATVLFRGASGRVFEVPLQLRVTAVRSIAVLGTREMRGLRSGDRLELAYRLVNAGNTRDTVRLVARGPAGWVLRLDRAAIAIVEPRAQLEFTVSIGVPVSANVGDHTISVAAVHPVGGDVLSLAYTTLGVTGRAGDVAGLVLRPTVAIATGAGATETFSGVELAGPVSASLSLRAQASPYATRGGVTTQGLSSVGAISAPFSAALYNERFELSLGNTGLQLSDLTGVNITGRGLTARAVSPAQELRAVVAEPSSVSAGTRGQLLGAGYWRETGRGRFGGSLSRLLERNGVGTSRELTSVAADYRSLPMGSVSLGAGLAHRSWADGSGLGYSLSAIHERPADRASLRVTHAPGGSAAFARASDEWQFDGSRVVNERLVVDASAQRAIDGGSFFGGLDARSWTIGQRYAQAENLAWGLRAQSSEFVASAPATSDIGDFGSRERALAANVEWRVSLLAISAEGTIGNVSRLTTLADGRRDRTTAAQRGARLNVTRAFERWGAFDAAAALEQTAAGVGVPGNVWSASVRWSEFPFAIGTRLARINLEQTVQRLGSLSPTVTTRATLRTALPGGLDLAVSGERNPFFRDASGRAGWIFAARLTASTRLYAPKALGPEGVVFEDADLDGTRDAGEAGVAGVVVRRGEDKATTDRQGRYRLPIAARGRTRIDQSSLPSGLVAHPSLAADSVERLDLPVLPTGSVEVELRLVADESGRLPALDLAPAVVMLRDATGFEWVARRTGPTRAVFDGIPVGEYVLVLNLTRLREPLRSEDGVAVRVAPRTTSAVVAPLRTRAVRTFTAPPRTGGTPKLEGGR